LHSQEQGVLFIIHHSSFIIHHSSFIIHHSSFMKKLSFPDKAAKKTTPAS